MTGHLKDHNTLLRWDKVLNRKTLYHLTNKKLVVLPASHADPEEYTPFPVSNNLMLSTLWTAVLKSKWYLGLLN